MYLTSGQCRLRLVLFRFEDALESLLEVRNILPGSILDRLVVGKFHSLFSGNFDELIVSGFAGVVLI